MAAWVDSVDGRTERALSFISRSLSDVQRSADQDFKLMKARAKSFRDLASTLDKEWENFRFPVPGSSRDLLGRFKERQHASPAPLAISPLTAISAQVEDVEFIRRLRPTLSTFRRIQSDPNFVKRDDSKRSRDRMDLSMLKKALAPLASDGDGDDPSTTSLEQRSPWVKGDNASWRWRERGTGTSAKRTRKMVKLPASEDWEPLKRMKEGLRDLESTAAKSKTPSEFLENVKKTELFENVKSSLKLTLPNSDGARKLTEEPGKDVAPLDVPELLENLVRQSEPFLDQLGVRKDVSVSFCKMLRRCKRASSGNAELVATSTESEPKDDLDLRVASVLQSTGYRYRGGMWKEGTEAADLPDDGRRKIAIVTTASLPWMTGTAVNPLFRAAYLAKDGMRNVTLLIPWLCKKDQALVYPSHMSFNTPEEQESYVRTWLEERIGFKADFKIAFYPGRFSTHKRSILACGDISQFIPDKEADVAVLEEPEHLTWYYHGRRWNKKFKDVIGVVHTNYLEYVQREKNGALQAFLLKHINNWVVGIYCNKVLRLSAATQELPKSQVCNVHGVSPKFLEIGKKVTVETDSGKSAFTKGAYFLGKMIWGKGYRELVNLLAQYKQDLADLKLDVYGSGEDAADVKSTAQNLGLGINFHQGRDHADESLHSYKVFINPSVSDVVCTTTAEALAMGKIVVCADHPSNEFFRGFPNCLTYSSPTEFVEKVKVAMASEPVPLSAEECHRLSWEAATERFLEMTKLDRGSASEQQAKAGAAVKRPMTLSMSLPNLRDVVDGTLALAHFVASGFEPARLVSGAIPGTMHCSVEQSKDLGLPPPLFHGF
ncbi:digalactosyldiacylglycerol synthase 2, chloroplastic [Selaginella moellendorffii]|uniref:digalactosyldiacylglycerol synthase 2, chloroplastic n=1 Tax=Selaginella moellendorffii TaxID=88036 RepID=UPI000D1C64D9|nr:digalactosyldiacylglycerol synthase 2, chloroplastic [Selaginella moellendorffii]|eukprot:XP_024519355.1 digalactosyldiacylglycerol synthase 2, chloroplastic [Selaginella moellendorffii]